MFCRNLDYIISLIYCFIKVILQHLRKYENNTIISSPQLKARELFWPFFCLSVCSSVCTLFIFLISSPKPLGRFHYNLAQNIIVWSRFKFIKIKGHVSFQRKIIRNYWKLFGIFQKPSLNISKNILPEKPKSGWRNLPMVWIQICSNHGFRCRAGPQ